MNLHNIGIIASAGKHNALIIGPVQINMTGSDFTRTSPNWNDFDKASAFTPLALLDNTGAASGMTIVATGFTPDQYGPSSPGSDANFPIDIVASQQYVGGGNPYACKIAGADPAKTYNIRVCVQCAGGGNVNIIVPGYSTVTVDSSSFTDTDFASVSPAGDGTIAISTLGTSNYSAINGLIITPN